MEDKVEKIIIQVFAGIIGAALAALVLWLMGCSKTVITIGFMTTIFVFIPAVLLVMDSES